MTRAKFKSFWDKFGTLSILIKSCQDCGGHRNICLQHHCNKGAYQRGYRAYGQINSGQVDSDVFIFDEPTKGIDVGAKAEIYNIMREMANAGKAIIVVSSEMPELLKTYLIHTGAFGIQRPYFLLGYFTLGLFI